MPPKSGSGGAGNKSAQNYVADLWRQGLTEAEAGHQRDRNCECWMSLSMFTCVVAVSAQVRQQLKHDGYKSGRISQLLKATRPVAAGSVMPQPAEDVSWRQSCVATTATEAV